MNRRWIERRRKLGGAGVALAIAASTGAAAADAGLIAAYDALLPPGREVCYVARPDDPLVARLRLHRLQDMLNANPDETGEHRAGLSILDLTPRPGMEPPGSPAGAPLKGRAYCSASTRLGAISCSDDSGCDSADRLRIEQTADGLRLVFRGRFSFANGGCGGVDDDEPEPQGVDLPDPRSKAQNFELTRRPIEDCR